MIEYHHDENCPVLQSLETLRDSIDAISCAADLVPEHDLDDGLAIALLFRRLSERLHGDYASIMLAYCDLTEKSA